MDHVFWVLDDRLGGRPGPTKEPWRLADLRFAIDVVVNISEHASPVAEFDALGIEHTWIPLPTTVPPHAEAQRSCLESLPRAEAYLSEQLQAGHRVLVHCVSGKDRTGMLLAYHLARTNGLTARESLSQVRKVRPEALSAEGWEAMAIRVISQLLAAAQQGATADVA
jgi:protein-tyrosine phosphatase